MKGCRLSSAAIVSNCTTGSASGTCVCSMGISRNVGIATFGAIGAVAGRIIDGCAAIADRAATAMGICIGPEASDSTMAGVGGRHGDGGDDEDEIDSGTEDEDDDIA